MGARRKFWRARNSRGLFTISYLPVGDYMVSGRVRRAETTSVRVDVAIKPRGRIHTLYGR